MRMCEVQVSKHASISQLVCWHDSLHVQVGDSTKAANESAVSPIMNFTHIAPFGNASDYPFYYGLTADLGQTVYSNTTAYGLMVSKVQCLTACFVLCSVCCFQVSNVSSSFYCGLTLDFGQTVYSNTTAYGLMVSAMPQQAMQCLNALYLLCSVLLVHMCNAVSSSCKKDGCLLFNLHIASEAALWLIVQK